MSQIWRWTLTGILLGVVACASGCVRQRVVLVPPGEPVQLAEDVKAFIYIEVKGERIKSEQRVILPEGWWVLPDDRDG